MDCQHPRWLPRCTMITGAWTSEPLMRLDGYYCGDCGTFIDIKEVIGASLVGEGRKALAEDSAPSF